MYYAYAVVEQPVVLNATANIEGVDLATADSVVEAGRERVGKDGRKKVRGELNDQKPTHT